MPPEEFSREMEDLSKSQLIGLLYQKTVSNEELNRTIQDLRQLVDTLNTTIANLNETILELRRKIYGSSSEKTKSGKPEEPASGSEDIPDPGTIEVKGYTRDKKKKATRNELYEKLPIQEEVFTLPEDQRNCPECGNLMTYMGKKFVREELRITPAVVRRVHIYQEVYECRSDHADDKPVIIQTPVPMSLLPHSPASASMVSYTMTQKFAGMQPAYRQEQAFWQLGVPIPRETLSNWMITCALEYLLPVYDALHRHLLERDVLHADEVPCQVLREEGRAATLKSYMWIYLTGNDGRPGIILYDYQPGRSGDYARDFLTGFKGFLQCDGYSGYNKVPEVILVCCLAHARRKFYEAIPAERRKGIKLLDIHSEQQIPWSACPDEESKSRQLASETGFAYCSHLFYLERKLKDLSPEERKARRDAEHRPVWDAFWSWLGTVTPTGGSKLEKAVTYARNHQETLMNYLKDGRCEISNNRAERRAKSYVQGRKNYLFHCSVDGAKASAVILSLVETAKANDLNIFQYLYTLLLFMPDYKNEPEGVEAMMPWSPFIQRRCTGLIDVKNVTLKSRGELPI